MTSMMKSCFLGIAGIVGVSAFVACSSSNDSAASTTTTTSATATSGAGGASSSTSTGTGGTGGMGCMELPAVPGKPHWTYDSMDAKDGPSAWGTIADEDGGAAYSACADTMNQQSPIALPSAANAAAMGGTTLDAMSLIWSNAAVVDSTINNGHTWQTNINAMPVNKLTYQGEDYALKQFHFHAPSEHTLDGKQFPMEMHFVHVGGAKAFATVVALFLEEDANDNAQIAKVWDKFNACPEAMADMAPAGTTLDLPSILPANWSHFEYDGSLTAPPCTRTVHFFVVTSPIKASAKQIKMFKDALGNTNRPTQTILDPMSVEYMMQ